MADRQAQIDKLNEARLRAFAEGLERLSSFDIERTEKDVTLEDYRAACTADLKKAMRRADVAKDE